jgi:hypothetical protein
VTRRLARVARLALVVVLVASTLVHAAPRKVLVLPLDGTAEPALRSKLSVSIQRLARVVDGEVTTGKTTFSETAAAVGCEPGTAACTESVRKLLGVDELIYGTADVERGQVTIVVHRTGHKTPPKQITTTIAATDSPDRADPAILPLFTGAQTTTTTTPPEDTTTTPDPTASPTVDPVPTEPAPQPLPALPARDKRERNIGIAMSVGGGVMLLIGLALWSSKASIQDEIDNHPTRDREDFAELEELESTASTRAWAGNLVVLGGLALGGYGGYLLWQDHKRQRSATIAPAPTTESPGVMLVLRGRL